MGCVASESQTGQVAKAQQEQPASVDAYVGAREDAAIWEKRALEAEELNRKFIAELNGPTYLGEPVKQEQPAQEPFKWYDGAPPFPQNQESFIAQTIYGERVVLRVLPEEYTYDYTTADGTHMKAENIKKWMQFPDCQFLPPKSAPTQPALSDDEIWQFWCNRPEVPEGEDDSMEAEFVAACKRAIESHCRGGK